MARIRSIKPEFPQSESMGRVSRDARLLFVMLWPICDDHGRARAASRMLASLLFPYDDDAPGLIDGWLDELEREGCITRYTVNGSTFLQVNNWLIHQKIDKPSKPQFPAIPGTLANPREDSSEERKGKEGKEKTLSADADSQADNDEGAKGEEPKRLIPVAAILAAYHEHCPSMPSVRVMTDARKRKLKARWTEDGERQSVEYWQKFFAYVAASDFLTGRDGRWTGCDFEWLIEAGNHVKVIEGKYENREQSA